MAEPALREPARMPRIDPAWHLPTEAELPCDDVFRIRDPATGADLRGPTELRPGLDDAETRARRAEQRVAELEAQLKRQTGDC